MEHFLVDENLPRTLARELRAGGVPAEDVRDGDLRGRTDEEILAAAWKRGAVLVTRDMGLANRVRIPERTRPGLVILRYPNEVSVASLVDEDVETLSGMPEEDLVGTLVIMQPGRVRIRRRR